MVYNLGGKRRQLQQRAKQTVVKKAAKVGKMFKTAATVTTLPTFVACYLRFHML